MITAVSPVQPVVPADIQEIESQVKSLSITTPQALQAASDLMIRIRKTRKMAEEALKVSLKPLKEQIKAQEDQARIGLTLLTNAESALQRGILDYQRKAREEAEHQQAKELAKYEKKVERLEAKAEADGKPLPIIAPPPIIQAPPTQVKTESGSLTAQTVKRWRLAGVSADELDNLRRDDPRAKAIPDAFFRLVPGEITRLVKTLGQAGKAMPGCPGIEVYEESTLSVR